MTQSPNLASNQETHELRSHMHPSITTFIKHQMLMGSKDWVRCFTHLSPVLTTETCHVPILKRGIWGSENVITRPMLHS